VLDVWSEGGYNRKKQRVRDSREKVMQINKNVSLKDKNWFKVGGSAAYFCEPANAQEFHKAFLFAKNQNLELEIIGKGANLLISDEGFDGLMVRSGMRSLSSETNSITVGSGVEIQDCIDFALENNLIGLEEFAGIPGTIGGAIYINIHYFQFFLGDHLTKATVMNKKTLEIKTVDKDWFAFGYDSTKLMKKETILLDATFSLTKTTDIETAYAKGRRDEIVRQRNSRYPTSNTCGSFFRNFEQHELKNVTNPKKLIFVAYYLDKLGIKGELNHGGATVSTKHANMIVNKGNATASDIVTLARKMQEAVFDAFQIIPQSECQFIGFKEHPLHRVNDPLSHRLASVRPNMKDQISSRKIFSR